MEFTSILDMEESAYREKRYPDFFRGVEDFYAEYGNYADDCLIRFASEIGFYLSFCRFERKAQR